MGPFLACAGTAEHNKPMDRFMPWPRHEGSPNDVGQRLESIPFRPKDVSILCRYRVRLADYSK